MYDMLCVYTVCMYVCCVYAVCMTCCVYIQYVMYVVCMCMFYVYECMNLASKVISGYLVSRYIWGSLGPSVVMREVVLYTTVCSWDSRHCPH